MRSGHQSGPVRLCVHARCTRHRTAALNVLGTPGPCYVESERVAANARFHPATSIKSFIGVALNKITSSSSCCSSIMLGGLGNKFNYTGAEVIPCHATHITVAVAASVRVIPENAFRPCDFDDDGNASLEGDGSRKRRRIGDHA